MSIGTWAGGESPSQEGDEQGYTATNESDVSAGSSGRTSSAQVESNVGNGNSVGMGAAGATDAGLDDMDVNIPGASTGDDTRTSSARGGQPGAGISATGVDADTDEMGGMGITDVGEGSMTAMGSTVMGEGTSSGMGQTGSPSGTGGSQGGTDRNMDEEDMGGLGTSSGNQGSMTGYGVTQSGSGGGSG